MSKRLEETDDLRDMGRFPVPIYVGAPENVLLTVVLTYLVRRDGRALAGVLALAFVCTFYPAWVRLFRSP